MTPTNNERAGRFTKKPVTIDAWLIDPDNKPHPSWVHNAFSGSDIDWCPAGNGLYINTQEGHMLGSHGDYLIRGVKGELYACKPDIFAATYEPEGRASMAANAPATKPAATVYMMEALVPGGLMKHHVQLLRPLPAGTLLYTAPPAPTEQWILAKDQLPPCRDDQLYIGVNFAGFAGVFNAVADIAGDVHCMYETAEETIDVMSGLEQWRVFDIPALPDTAAKGANHG